MIEKNLAGRLDGLDLARFIAFMGMVIVNFKIAMGAEGTHDGLISLITVALEGRAAATFVVLAGIGLGLATTRSGQAQPVSVTLKRAAFLLAIGLLNSLVFDADILHYYAFYFFFGVFCLPASARALVCLILILNLTFVAMILAFNYDTGWDWTDYSYADFWTPAGFTRNLFFNGWHPVIPWLSFLLFGILIARLKLDKRSVQIRMILLGSVIFLVNEILSAFLTNMTVSANTDCVALFGTGPVPPMPLYTVAGMSVATATIGICLRISGWCQHSAILKMITPAGRQTLTLYIAHILIGMGTLEELGLLGGQSLAAAVSAALLFCILATVYAYFWSKLFKRGPIEIVKRKIAG